jgi:hypothetical protein
MNNEISKNVLTTQAIASAGLTDTDDDDSDRLVKGIVVKFDPATAEWKGDIDPDARYIVTGVIVALQRWKNQRVIDEIVRVPGGEPLPNVEALNREIPVEEWEIGSDDRPRAPWQRTRFIYMFEPRTAMTCTYISTTIGGEICCRELKEATISKQKLWQNDQLCPIVQLGSATMKTRHRPTTGMPRPKLVVVGWIGGKPASQLSDAETAQLEGPGEIIPPDEAPPYDEAPYDEASAETSEVDETEVDEEPPSPPSPKEKPPKEKASPVEQARDRLQRLRPGAQAEQEKPAPTKSTPMKPAAQAQKKEKRSR